jgi:hypothetical protein
MWIGQLVGIKTSLVSFLAVIADGARSYCQGQRDVARATRGYGVGVLRSCRRVKVAHRLH